MPRACRPTATLLLKMVAASALYLCLSPTAFMGGGPSTAQRARELTPNDEFVASGETMGKVVDVVAESLGVDKGKVVGSATLSDLGASSLMIVDTVIALEETFNVELAEAAMDIELPTKETAKLRSVQDVADLIQTKLDEWVIARRAAWATM